MASRGADARSGGRDGTMDELTLVVMAAGIGRRYGGLKQIEPIGPNGEWFVDYSVYDALRSGFTRIVFVVRGEIEAEFRERYGDVLPAVCRVEYVVQSLDDLPAGFSPPAGRVKPWGTGHAVWSCRNVIDGPFGVINADDFYGRGAFEALAGHFARNRRAEGEHVLVGYELANTLTAHGSVRRGVCCVDDDGLLIDVRERHRIARRAGSITSSEDGETWTEIPGDTIVSLNTWGFGAEFMAGLSRQFPAFLSSRAAELGTAEFFLPDTVGRLIAEGEARVRVLATDETWFGVTYPEDVQRARREIADRIAAGAYPARLWSP